MTGPRYGALADEIRIPEGLRPGLYRVVKPVSAPSRGKESGPTVRLSDTFVVRRG